MYAVIGGKADGTTCRGDRVTAQLLGEPYIALEFSPDPKDKRKTVTIYMRCGMTPLDAMAIWRERNMTDEAYENYKVLVDKLLAATPEEIEAEGREPFAQMCEKARESILAEKRPNRLTMATALGIKAADAREGKISAGIKASNAHTLKERDKPRSPAGSSGNNNPSKTGRAAVKREGKPRDTPLHPNPMGALPIPGCLPDDPDDAAW